VRRIAIIGGGPGGAHCARRLAESGVEVTLFEPRSRFEKPCGGGIPARGLETYPFLEDARLPARSIRVCRLVAPSGAEAEIPLAQPLLVFARADLHAFLLDRAAVAGVRRVSRRVIGFDSGRGNDGWRDWTLTTAAAGGPRETHGPFDFLIAADGAGGFCRRRLAGTIRAAELTQAVGCHVHGVTDQAITLKFYERLNGYLWAFPRTDHASVGICDTLGARPASELRDLLACFVRQRYGPGHLARATPYAALIPGAPAAPGSARLQGEGWALVGDTGRSVDPLTREGIYYAMVSADLLAEALARGRPEAYAASWERALGGEFAWAARHSERFFTGPFLERLVAVCDRSPRSAAILSDVISGRQPYRTLRLRLLANGPLIGWQLVRRDGRMRFRPAHGS
jgi:geranylgeranyl reductase